MCKKKFGTEFFVDIYSILNLANFGSLQGIPCFNCFPVSVLKIMVLIVTVPCHSLSLTSHLILFLAFVNFVHLRL